MKELNHSTIDTISETETASQLIISDTTIEVKSDTYEKLAVKLKEAIGDNYFYNGSIDCDSGNIYSSLTATLIIYRTDRSYPEGNVSTISDVVPVWWEYSTAISGIGEVLNDFCFSNLREAMLLAN